MDNSGKPIKWQTIIFGVLLIGLNFYHSGDDMEQSDLSSKTITLHLNIENIRSPKGTSNYKRMWTNETKAAFIINTPGDAATEGNGLDSLKKGDTLTVQYYSARKTDLNNGVKEIPIYYLKKGNREYFNVKSYNKAKHAINKKLLMLTVPLGILLLLNGFGLITTKVSWIAGGTVVGVLVVLVAMNVV